MLGGEGTDFAPEAVFWGKKKNWGALVPKLGELGMPPWGWERWVAPKASRGWLILAVLWVERRDL